MLRASLVAFCSMVSMGCGDAAGYEVPGPDTDPRVVLPLSEARRIDRGEDPEGVGVVFGPGSNDLVVVFAGQGGDQPDRVIDFAHPDSSELIGYGAFEGVREIYRRTPSVDDNGIHGTRTAVYRVDPEGNHTNAWYVHWASSAGIDGRIYLTQYEHWDWQGGQEVSETFSGSAWPIIGLLEDSQDLSATVFSVLPGAFTAGEYSFSAVEGSGAVSPTLEVPDCIVLSFSDVGGADYFLAYFHEQIGLVEVLYDWKWANSVVDLDDVLPISGFAVADPVAMQRTLQTSAVWFGGTYAAIVDAHAFVPGQGFPEPPVLVPWELTLSIDFEGTEARAASGRHTIHGSFRESDGGEYELVGISDGFEFELRSRNSDRDNGVGRPSIEIFGKAVDGAGGQPALSADLYRYPASNGDTAIGVALTGWTPR